MFIILLTLLSTVHFIIGGIAIANFSTFFEATFGQDLLSYVEANGSFVPPEGFDVAEVELRFASINAFLEPWGICGGVLFVLQLWLILVIFITLNIPAASKSFKSFNAVFQFYNLMRWSMGATAESASHVCGNLALLVSPCTRRDKTLWPQAPASSSPSCTCHGGARSCM